MTSEMTDSITGEVTAVERRPGKRERLIAAATQLVHQQGTVMAFADVFLLLCLLFAAFAVLVAIMRRPVTVPASADAH